MSSQTLRASKRRWDKRYEPPSLSEPILEITTNSKVSPTCNSSSLTLNSRAGTTPSTPAFSIPTMACLESSKAKTSRYLKLLINLLLLYHSWTMSSLTTNSKLHFNVLLYKIPVKTINWLAFFRLLPLSQRLPHQYSMELYLVLLRHLP